jgi:lipopolysaccharide/colanic/teichoic acid biosynthesis glycosyltransferase
VIYRRFGKRIIDVVASGVLLLAFAIPILGGLTLIRFSSPGPGMFRQVRVGKNGTTFTILKLRTMTVNPDREMVQTSTTDPEVLPVGRLLRRLKIDELPQLWNVFRGDMSLVGPRPCLEQTRDEMPAWARRRFDVRPGLTGLAQVNGNVALSWEERWRHDVKYVEEFSCLLDARVLIKTALVVFLGEERFRSAA